jgi:hypothetical protein
MATTIKSCAIPDFTIRATITLSIWFDGEVSSLLAIGAKQSNNKTADNTTACFNVFVLSWIESLRSRQFDTSACETKACVLAPQRLAFRRYR